MLFRSLPNFGEPPRLESIIAELRLAIEGGHDVGGRVRQRDADYVQPSSAVRPASRVDVIEGASVRATVLEVRAHDVPGLLHHISGAIARTGTTITGAKVATIGSEAVDVFFLVDPAGRALTSRQAARVRSRVLSELAGR